MQSFSRFLCGCVVTTVLLSSASIEAHSLRNIISRGLQERIRQRSVARSSPNRERFKTASPFGRPTGRRSTILDDISPEDRQLAQDPVTFSYSENEIDRLRAQLNARTRMSLGRQQECRESTSDWDHNCNLDEDGLVSSFYRELPNKLASSILSMPYSYDSLVILKKIDNGFWAWSNHWEPRDGYLRNMTNLVARVTELRRTQMERSLRPRIIADVSAGKSGLVYELFGDDAVRDKFYSSQVQRNLEIANAPLQSTSEGKILSAALQSLYQAPGFAGARLVNLAEKRPSSVRIGAIGTYYDYTVSIRNAKCQIIKSGNSCNYDMKIGIQASMMGLQLPTYELAWIPRRDIFQAGSNGLSSASLTAAMEKVAESQSSSSRYTSSNGSSDINEANRNNEQLERNLQDIQNGLYSTGKVIYDRP